MNKCPCNKCICVPVCRIKQYTRLTEDCSVLWSYLKQPWIVTIRSNGRLKLVHKALSPVMWTLFCDQYGRIMVDNDTGWGQCHFHY